MMIQTLQEELEYERARSEDLEAGRDVEERRTSLLDSTRAAEGPWEWRKWMDRSWVWLFCVYGLDASLGTGYFGTKG
jgi:hypothetical protein